MAMHSVGGDAIPAKTVTMTEEAARFGSGVLQAANMAEAQLTLALEALIKHGDDKEMISRVEIVLGRAIKDLGAAVSGMRPGYDEFGSIATELGSPPFE